MLGVRTEYQWQGQQTVKLGLTPGENKRTITFMRNELKFNEVVKRARLDGQTAQYVLKHPADLSGMPTAGSQGAHRKFTHHQALRLAICTHLVKAGIPLRRAGKVAIFCEDRLKRLSGIRPPYQRNQRLYYGPEAMHPWILRIIDGRYVRLWCEKLDRDFNNDEEYFDLVDETIESGVVMLLTKFEFDLTTLEIRLSKDD